MSRNRPWVERRPKNALSGYRLASAAEKRRLVLARMRPLEVVRCSCCTTAVTQAQLQDHVQARCLGGVAERDAFILRGRGK